MEKGQQLQSTMASPAPVLPPASPAPLPSVFTGSYTPPHTQTQSTLAPTSEYVRYLLLALPARYVPRGIFGTAFEKTPFTGSKLAQWLAKPGVYLQQKFHRSSPENMEALAYNTVLGLGSLALTASYSWTVYRDIQNIFSEAVAEEVGKPAAKVTPKDMQKSDNRIVRRTMENFWARTARRVFTDLLFFPAAMMRSAPAGDLMIGIKALQAFAETWKRKTTMFEDLVTFVNNKINPRNGLGQAISVGEVFDLYQHYAEVFTPNRMFTNVLEQGTGEGALWAANQPIFQRMTELMNLTYAYKHSSVIDPATGHAVHQANFALPKFIYLLGHDLIDVHKPAETLATIEIANRYGIPAVKEMQTMLKQGVDLAQVVARFPLPEPTLPQKKAPEAGKNGVIAKGSTMQLDTAEDAPTIPLNMVASPSVELQHTLATPGERLCAQPA